MTYHNSFPFVLSLQLHVCLSILQGNAGPYEYRRVYRISLITWTVVGLSWLSLVIGSIQDFAQCIVDKTEAIDKSEVSLINLFN